MVFKEINSRQNHFIKYSLSLKEKKRRDIEKSCLVEGEKILCDLADHNISIRMFFISESAYKNTTQNAEKIAKRAHYNFIVPDSLMNYISTTETSAGFLAIIETQPDIVFEINIEQNGCYLILDSIQDPGNCGTIFRSAAALGISGIILYGNCTDPYSPKSIRASSGQTLLMPLYKLETIDELKDLEKQNLKFYGTSSRGEISLEQFSFPTPLAFIMGNESKGVSNPLNALITSNIKIPISKAVESLNVSTAASILCWEWYRNLII